MITAITNTSGATQFFAWIPPHGRRLADNEQTYIFGDLWTLLASGLNRYNRSRELASAEAAEAAGDVAVCTYEVNPCTSSGSSLIP